MISKLEVFSEAFSRKNFVSALIQFNWARAVYVLLATLLFNATAGQAADMEITPFRTVNQRPLVLIYGLPSESAAVLTPAGHSAFSFTQDVTSESTFSETRNEQIFLDGESYRWTLSARYGFSNRFEAGIDIPYILYGGGFLDGLIVDWHKTFNLPQGGRESAPKNRINYSYFKDGVRKLDIRNASSGIGEIVLNGGMLLHEAADAEFHESLALRTSLKLPTGESSSLRGSGSTDFSLYLCGAINNFTEWGSLGVFGSAGGMVLTKGDVLPDQQNNLVAFGMVGLGWGPAEWISFKLQLNAHTALYHDSALNELSQHSLMMVVGGALKLPDGYLLDIGVSENVAVATAPDISFHLGLSKQF